MQRLLPPALFVIAALFAVKLHWFRPIAQPIAPPYNWAGLIVVIAGLGTAAWHSRLFRRLGTNIHTFRDPNQLVTSGLFRVTRNPMYLGFVLALVGIAILLGSVSPFLVAMAFTVITDRWYVAFEENALEAKFGEPYRSYRARVRRWI